MNIYKFPLISFFLISIGFTYAQQIPQFSQRMLDKLVFNPAVAGSKYYPDIILHHRSQWVGFDDAPVTDMLSYHNHIGLRMGVGGYLVNYVTGPIKKSAVNISYAYHIPFNTFSLSLGLSGSLLQYSIDKNKIVLRENDDAVVMGLSDNTWEPDASFGVFFYNRNLFFGLSVLQLFQSKIILSFNDNLSAIVPLTQHYYLIGGYNFKKNEKYDIEPSILIGNTTGSPLQIDFNIRVDYMNKLMGGFSYRHKDAFVLLTGARIKKYYFIAYSYDIVVSNLKKYNSGSHEIILSINFPYYRKDRTKYDIRRSVRENKRRL